MVSKAYLQHFCACWNSGPGMNSILKANEINYIWMLDFIAIWFNLVEMKLFQNIVNFSNVDKPYNLRILSIIACQNIQEGFFFKNWIWTRSSWLDCALRDDEAVYWVSLGHNKAVSVGNWWYWVRRGHLCLYHILKKWRSGQVSRVAYSLTDFER